MSKRTRIGNRYVTRTKEGRFKTNVDVGRSLSADRRSKSKNTVKAGRGHQGDIKRAEGGCGCGANSSMGGKTFAACGCGSKKKAETFGSESGGAGHLVCTECKTSHDIRDTDGWLMYGAGTGMKEILCPECGYGEGAGYLVCTIEGCYKSGDINTDGWYIGSLGKNPTVYCPTHGREEYPEYYDDDYNAESFDAESRFDTLANKVAKDYEGKGYSKKEALEIGKRVAYSQGVKKYGKAGMTRLSKEGRKKSMKKSADSYSLNAESGQVNNMSWENSEPYATLEGYNPVDSVIASPPLGRGVAQDFGAEYHDMESQGYDDKMDESLGMRHRGRHSQSMKDRRDEASAMDKRHSKKHRKYDDVETMDLRTEYDSPYGTRQTTDFGMVGMGNDFAQNRAETFGAEGGSEFMTGARYGAGAVVGITGATIILGTIMNLFMRR